MYIQYALYFLSFMLVEERINTNVNIILGGEYVVMVYAIGLCFTALGYWLYSLIYSKYKKIFNKWIIGNAICIFLTVIGIYNSDNKALLLICSLGGLIFLGILGGCLSHSMVAEVVYRKHSATMLGISMAGGIVMQYIFDNHIKSNRLLIENIFVIIFVLAVLILEKVLKNIKRDEGCAECPVYTINKSTIVALIAGVAIMSIILGINDEIIVELNSGKEIELFSGVRLLYAVGLIVAGIIADYGKRRAMALATGLVMMLSVVACTFLTDPKYYNLNLTFMYFYCGFYVIFLTVAFMELAHYSRRPELWAGMGRIVRSFTTAVVTVLIFFIFHIAPVMVWTLVSCVLSMLLILIWSVCGMILPKYKEEKSEEQLISEEEKWSVFVDKYNFTEREKVVVEKLIKSEKTVQEIADELFISRRVAQRHIAEIYKKTGAKTRSGLVYEYTK